MADNTPFVSSLDPASPKIADREVSHSGDTAKVQLIQLASATGVEGAYTLRTSSIGPGGGQRTEATCRAVPFVVPLGQTVPAAGIDTDGARSLGLIVLANFDGTQIRFQVSTDNLTFYNLYDASGTRVTQTVQSGANNLFAEVLDYQYIKVETVTVQAGTDTNFILCMRS